jgi:hypothetical protein
MGQLKLTTASGGSVILNPSNTASDYTISVPAVTGTMAYVDGSSNLQMNSGYGSNATAYGCRAWVNFNGTGTVAIRASGNVSSITDLGTGIYRINFTNSMPDANYSVAVSSNNQVTNTNSANNIYNFLVGSFTWEHIENGTQADASELRAALFR